MKNLKKYYPLIFSGVILILGLVAFLMPNEADKTKISDLQQQVKQLQGQLEQAEIIDNSNQGLGAEQACLGSGGMIVEASCCASVSNFPNNCLIGACGCSPDNSHSVQSCNCGSGKCFDGSTCVSISQPDTANINENLNVNEPSEDNANEIITLSDNNKTVELKVGSKITLNLGDLYDWQLSFSDNSILNQDVQGVYKAVKTGDIVLTAVGDPKCRQSRPACAMPSILFTLNIVVK